MEVKSTKDWDETFFAQWVEFANSLYDSSKHLKKDIEGIKRVLGDKKYFPDDTWIALSCFDAEKIVARGLVAVNSRHPHIAKVGYLEFIEDFEAFNFFWLEVEKISA